MRRALLWGSTQAAKAVKKPSRHESTVAVAVGVSWFRVSSAVLFPALRLACDAPCVTMERFAPTRLAMKRPAFASGLWMSRQRWQTNRFCDRRLSG